MSAIALHCSFAQQRFFIIILRVGILSYKGNDDAAAELLKKMKKKKKNKEGGGE